MVDFSKMKDLKKSKKLDHDDNHNLREDTFREKVALQQFMNHNGPIFRAFARVGVPISEVADGTVLVGPTSAANELAKLVATGITATGKEIGNREVSFFRAEAANWVAERWARDEDYDIEWASKEIVNVVLSAMKSDGKSFDYDPYKDDNISSDASLMMSAASVTAKLLKQVDVYDFRVGRNRVLKTLLDAVIGTSVDVAAQMLPKGAHKNDIANLTQTVSRNFSVIMEGIYERKAREVTSTLTGKETSHKVAWLKANSPLDSILDEFKDWAYCFVGFAMATCNKISPANENKSNISKNN